MVVPTRSLRGAPAGTSSAGVGSRAKGGGTSVVSPSAVVGGEAVVLHDCRVVCPKSQLVISEDRVEDPAAKMVARQCGVMLVWANRHSCCLWHSVLKTVVLRACAVACPGFEVFNAVLSTQLARWLCAHGVHISHGDHAHEDQEAQLAAHV